MNRDLKEYNEWDSSQNSALSNLKRNLGPFQLVGLIIIFLIAYKVLTDSGLNRNVMYGGLIIFALGIIWLMNRAKAQQPIPENVIKIITLSLIKRKVGVEYPAGTQVVTLPYCALRQTGAWGLSWAPWRWEIGVKIITPNGLKRDVLVCLHPYDGYITRIQDMPSGYNGTESPDIKTAIPEVYEKIEEKN